MNVFVMQMVLCSVWGESRLLSSERGHCRWRVPHRLSWELRYQLKRLMLLKRKMMGLMRLWTAQKRGILLWSLGPPYASMSLKPMKMKMTREQGNTTGEILMQDFVEAWPTMTPRSLKIEMLISGLGGLSKMSAIAM